VFHLDGGIGFWGPNVYLRPEFVPGYIDFGLAPAGHFLSYSYFDSLSSLGDSRISGGSQDTTGITFTWTPLPPVSVPEPLALLGGALGVGLLAIRRGVSSRTR
jgi:hypothetical protein